MQLMKSLLVMPSTSPLLIVSTLLYTVTCIGYQHCCAADSHVKILTATDFTHDVTSDLLATSTSTIGVPDIVTTVTTGDDSSVSTTGCGTTKGCMHYPAGCQSPGGCTHVLTWSKSEPGFVDFELMSPSIGWVAVGLSNDEFMRDDSVIHCIVNTTTSKVSVGFSYNINSTKSNVYITANVTTVKSISALYVNGTLHCRFQRSVPGESLEIFPLDGSYYLFIGAGPPPSATGLSYHSGGKPFISPRRVNVTSEFEDLTPGSTTTWTTWNTQSINVSSSPSVSPAAEGCGVTVGCFNDTRGNSVLYSMTDDGLDVEFEINCNKSASSWCAIGFSDSRGMGSTSVIECMLNSTGHFTVQHSYNTGYINEDVDNSSAGITLMSTSHVGDMFSCHFRRSILVGANDKIYDLDRAYYLMLATGPLSSTTPNRKLKHTSSPLVSSSTIDVRFSSNSTSGSTAPTISPTTVAAPGGDDCGVTFGCFSANDGSLLKFSATSDDLDVEFEISCLTNTNAGWCAVGFSNDDRMDSTSVIDCIVDGNGNFKVQHSYNEHYSNNEIGNPSEYIRVLGTTHEDGVLKCSFYRRILIEGNDKIFNLDTAYYLFLGRGPVTSSGEKMIHYNKPAVSSEKIDVRVTYVASQKAQYGVSLVRAHGCLMITAWVLLVSTSIILARYFKTAWPGDKLCDTAIWFAAHRFMMVLALSCTAAGFTIIFVYNEGQYAKFPDDADSYFKLHAPLGIIVMILVITNPVMALFRCNPGTAKRPIFNWMHWLVGTTCHILAIITVFIGVKIGEKSTGDEHISHNSIFWILLGFVVFHIIVEVTLTAHKFAVDIAAKSVPEAKYTTEEENKDEPNKTTGDLKFRYAILIVYGIVNLGVWLAIICMIGSGSVE